MIILDIEQGTDEWMRARAGIPSASNFSRILSPTGKPSTQATDYADELAGELWHRSLGTFQPEGSHSTDWMDRGQRLEAEAREAFAFMNDVDVQQVGFCLHDSREFGCSPDGLVGDDSGLEIKCPKRKNHFITAKNRAMPAKYIPQVQGSMLVTGRSSWWFMSYYPGLPPAIISVERDEEFCAQLHELLQKFTRQVQNTMEKVIEQSQV